MCVVLRVVCVDVFVVDACCLMSLCFCCDVCVVLLVLCASLFCDLFVVVLVLNMIVCD